MRKLFYNFLICLLLGTGLQAQSGHKWQLFFLTSLLPDSVKLRDARALSSDLSGNIYIADTGNNRILKVTAQGEIIKAIGGFGWEPEQFYTPLDICATSGLDVFVADYDNHRIQRYDKDLNYISSLVSDESWDEEFQFSYPRSAAISKHGSLFIIDGENVRVIKFDSFGEPEISFGDYGEGKGQLLNPAQIAISDEDLIYVSDRQAKKVFVFDYFGNYIGAFGSGILTEPEGIFFRDERLYVADAGAKSVFIFSANGELILKRQKISKERGNFRYPRDIAAYGNKIFVLDGDEILVFEMK